MRPTVLIVDDEPLFLKALGRVLTGEGYEVVLTGTAGECIEQFKKISPDMVLLDLGLPDMNGLSLLKEVKGINEDTVFIMMTGQGGVKEAVEAIKLGAMDYLCKPLDMEELKAVMARLSDVWSLRKKVSEFRKSAEDRYSFGRIIRKSKKMDEVVRLAEKISKSGSSTVLIQGESGTGKGLLAAALHYNSSRKNGPFIKLNCATLVEGLLESELFGHEKGAFTGAVKRKPGKFELADKGSIFLDEIGEMSLNLQVKLLKVIEEKEFDRVGGTSPVKVDVRLIAATNRDLVKAMQDGIFREDLFYRLNVFPIHIPSLRERKEDIQLLATNFLDEYNREFGKGVKVFSEEVLRFIEGNEWKGNVRELRNFVERAVLLAQGETIHLDSSMLQATAREKEGPVLQDFSLLPLEEMEAIYVKKVLEKTGGNKSEAAQLLGITRQRLRRILQL